MINIKDKIQSYEFETGQQGEQRISISSNGIIFIGTKGEIQGTISIGKDGIEIWNPPKKLIKTQRKSFFSRIFGA